METREPYDDELNDLVFTTGDGVEVETEETVDFDWSSKPINVPAPIMDRPPTEPGFYWLRLTCWPNEPWQLTAVDFFQDDDNLCAILVNPSSLLCPYVDVEQVCNIKDAEWSGPILPPMT